MKLVIADTALLNIWFPLATLMLVREDSTPRAIDSICIP